MAEIFTKRLVNMGEVATILEDNFPHYDLEMRGSMTDVKPSTTDPTPRLRVRKATHIGAELLLSVNLSFSRDNVQKLRECGIADSLLSGLEQAPDAVPIRADAIPFWNYLKKKLGRRRANELLRQHSTTIFEACALNSVITIIPWDPNALGGQLSGG
jgi:hypothetical protein